MGALDKSQFYDFSLDAASGPLVLRKLKNAIRKHGAPPMQTTDEYPNSAWPTTDLDCRQLAIIEEAIGILEQKLRSQEIFTSPSAVKHFCQLQIARETEEHFCCLFLDSQHQLIAFEKLFRGTVDGAAVYPRVVLRRAMAHNAAALILAHNHPSGVTEASSADRRITDRLKQALALVDLRVLDHIIVGTNGTYSMAEEGLI